tara:strand:+ start:360 stop:665 length:306 start_codon:yes stop_codon:yes gene_type:complete
VDIIQTVETLGIPVAVAAVLGYACWYLIKFITVQLTVFLTESFERHEKIMIKLIDQSKAEMVATVKHNTEIYTKLDTLISVVTQLMNGIKKNGNGRYNKIN